jgi:cell wall-associated NlpC family hydrolase
MQRVLAIAHDQIGTPYVWGKSSPKEGFDCSGLIEYAYEKAGIPTPGRLTTYSMAKLGKSVKGQQYRPGDWVLSNHGEHVTMYVGKGKVIAAPHTGEVVQYQDLKNIKGIVDVRRFA